MCPAVVSPTEHPACTVICMTPYHRMMSLYRVSGYAQRNTKLYNKSYDKPYDKVGLALRDIGNRMTSSATGD